MYDYVSVTTADAGAPTPVRDGTIKLHDEAGFSGMRKAGRLSAEILDALVTFVHVFRVEPVFVVECGHTEGEGGGGGGQALPRPPIEGVLPEVTS